MRMIPSREYKLIKLLGLRYQGCSEKYVRTDHGMWSEWEYFGRLWEYGSSQKWWPKFKDKVIGAEGDGTYGPLFYPIEEHFVYPENFIKAFYEFTQDLGLVDKEK